MATIKHQVRTNQPLLVIQNSNSGMSIVDACQKVGIARSTFYHFIVHHPDAIASFQEMKLLSAIQQFSRILEKEEEILERVIQEGLADTTKPRHRLAVCKFIMKRSDELERELNSYRVGGQNAADFLTGPKLVPGESRMTS